MSLGSRAGRRPADRDANRGGSKKEAVGLAALRPQLTIRPKKAPQRVENAQFALGNGARGRTPPAKNPLCPAAAPAIRPEMAPQRVEKPQFAPGNGALSGRNAPLCSACPIRINLEAKPIDRARAAISAALSICSLVLLKPYVSCARLREAEHDGRGGRHVDDSAANEWAPVDDFHDGVAAIVEIEHPDLSSKRQSPMGRNQTAVTRTLIIRS